MPPTHLPSDGITHYCFSHFRFDRTSGCLYLTKKSTETALVTEEKEQCGKSSEHSVTALHAPLEISLRHKVASLLDYLIQHRQRVVSKEELLGALWEHGDYRENSLTQSIRELRKNLGDNAQNPVFIRTFPQRGYQWVCETESLRPTQMETPETTGREHKPEPATVIETADRASIIDNDLMAPPTQSAAVALEQGSGSHVQDSTLDSLIHDVTNESTLSRLRAWTRVLVQVKWIVLLCLVMAGLITELSAHYFSRQQNSQTSAETEQEHHARHQRILILPLLNETQDDSMDWLELGLADMLADELHGAPNLTVVPPMTAHQWLLSENVAWPGLPAQVRALLQLHNMDSALYASVRLHKGQQVLDFQLLFQDGKVKQGSIRYPSLPAATAAIAKQLTHLITPVQPRAPLSQASEEATNPIAAQALAEGIDTLKRHGASDAERYFRASRILQPNSPWATVHHAESLLLLGQYSDASDLLSRIRATCSRCDARLQADIIYWQAELIARQQGQDSPAFLTVLEQAIGPAKASGDENQLARIYRLRANAAWHQLDWDAHAVWLEKADQLASFNNTLQIQADKLFYLGNPANDGLERAPDNDLEDNQQYLLRALNFYQQLRHQPMVIATEFALARNFILPMDVRKQSLDTAIAGYRALAYPYELTQTLIYAGFFNMQLHRGDQAAQYFDEAHALAHRHGLNDLLKLARFYQAFALLDQGLDQQALGRHGRDAEKLRSAINAFQAVLNDKQSTVLKTGTLVFLGWAYADLDDYNTARVYLEQAKTLSDRYRMPVTYGYASYSLMKTYLDEGNFQAVITMKADRITTRLQAIYLARAYYEQGQASEAAAVLLHLQQSLPAIWQPEDDQRLKHYQQMSQQHSEKGTHAITPFAALLPEPDAHLVYCESDWALSSAL